MKIESKKSAACGDHRITLIMNNTLTNDPCAICGECCNPDGFDFVIADTQALVCSECAKQKARSIYDIWYYAHRWNKYGTKAAMQSGINMGKRAEAQRILKEISAWIKFDEMPENAEGDLPF